MAEHTLRVRRGVSFATDAREAVRELRDAIHARNEELVVVFASPRYDLDALGRALRKAFDAPIIGCTTAGEIAPDGYRDGSLVGVSLTSARLAAEPFLIERLDSFDTRAAEALSTRLAHAEAKARKRLPSAKSLGVLFIDGQSQLEEQVAGNLYIATHGMPLVGASAGDDLARQSTAVYWDGKFLSGAAVLALVSSSHPFAIATTRHTTCSDDKLVVTDADPQRRIVTELSGKPAAREYAKLLGLTERDLVPGVFARRPLVMRIGSECFVRGVVGVRDNALVFSCAVDTGMVLALARDFDPMSALTDCIARGLRAVPEPRLVLGFESVLRKLALNEDQRVEEAEEILRRYPSIGFHGYGEQLNALHLNQTFTALLLGE